MSVNRRKILVDVVCPDCGKIRQRERRDLNRYSHYCRSCGQKYKQTSDYSSGRKAHNDAIKALYEKCSFDVCNLTFLPKPKMRRIHKAALHRGLNWNLTALFLENLYNKQHGKCVYTGILLHLNYGKNSLSLDRIDSNLGYVETNVQWVIKEINFMKQSLTHADFLYYCRLVTTKENKNESY